MNVKQDMRKRIKILAIIVASCFLILLINALFLNLPEKWMDVIQNLGLIATFLILVSYIRLLFQKK